MKKKTRAQKLLLLHKNHQPWVPSSLVAQLPPEQESTSPKAAAFLFQSGSIHLPLGLRIQTGQTELISKKGQSLAQCFRRQGLINANWHKFTLKCIQKMIWAMDRWTLCGKANVANDNCRMEAVGLECTLQNSFNFPYEKFHSKVLGENVNEDHAKTLTGRTRGPQKVG